jgi:hypothetical protein
MTEDARRKFRTVKVLINGKEQTGVIRGYLRPFANIFVDGQVCRHFEASWETVARCVSEGRPLKV